MFQSVEALLIARYFSFYSVGMILTDVASIFAGFAILMT